MIFQQHLRILLLMICLIIGSSCTTKKAIYSLNYPIAVIADAHLSDVYGQLKAVDFQGLRSTENGQDILIRTMESQLHSTRIFNENYFAFLSALDDVVKRKIKYVILPGDFSDDGQPIHLQGLKNILDHYTNTYGIRFFLITGNHDVVQPFDHRDGKTDFLGKGGRSQPIMSQPGMYNPDPLKEHPVVVSSELQNLGYEEITKVLGDYGFFPNKEDLYWESPFSNYSYSSYNFKMAKEMASLEHRSYQTSFNDLPIPDISYLVEPVEGLWLLALDANTYRKKIKVNGDNSQVEYPNTAIGLDNLLGDKKYLMDWVRKVTENAKKQNKSLIAFSHYPMVEFNDGASSDMEELLVGSKMQIKRVPNAKVAEQFADAGLKLHLGGHMHINDTGVATSETGNTLINIQTPSLAAYIPAYKIITLKKPEIMVVETVIMDSVRRFNEFFELYDQEYDFLENHQPKNIWNKDILTSKTYAEFMDWHLKELVRLRFLPNEWPQEFRDILVVLSGKDLFMLSHTDNSTSFINDLEDMKKNSKKGSKYINNMRLQVQEHGLSLDQFSEWSGYDLLVDLYRLRSADELAKDIIGVDRINQYRLLIDSFLNNPSYNTSADPLKKDMILLMNIFNKFLSGAPSDHFQIDLKTGTIITLKQPTHENKK